MIRKLYRWIIGTSLDHERLMARYQGCTAIENMILDRAREKNPELYAEVIELLR